MTADQAAQVEESSGAPPAPVPADDPAPDSLGPRLHSLKHRLHFLGRRLLDAPRTPLITGIVLAVAALAEVTVRLQIGASSITRVQAGRPGAQAVTVGGQNLSVPLVIVICLVVLGSTLPLASRRAGAPALAAFSVLSLALLGQLTGAAVLALLLATFRLANSGSRVPASAIGLPFLVLALHPPDIPGGRPLTVLLAALVPTAAAAGSGLRARRESSQSSAAAREFDGNRMIWTAQGERARIARELHDVVAHHISLIAVQAETARLTTPGISANGAAQLRGIGDTARAALTEMRRLLGVLREEGAAQQPEPREPQPGLLQFTQLLDQARDGAGSAVRLILRGSPAPLATGVELAAYRIVQESLTNARRHAPGAAVDVELVYTRTALRLRIRDNGPGPAADAAPGLGLLGITERAHAVGGRVEIGPGPGGGFQIEATLPTKEAG